MGSPKGLKLLPHDPPNTGLMGQVLEPANMGSLGGPWDQESTLLIGINRFIDFIDFC